MDQMYTKGRERESKPTKNDYVLPKVGFSMSRLTIEYMRQLNCPLLRVSELESKHIIRVDRGCMF